MPNQPLKLNIQESLSFVVTKSTTEASRDEPSLPPIYDHHLYSHAAMARARAIIEQTEKPASPTDRGIGALLLASILLLFGIVYLLLALHQRDGVQRLQYQREVAPVLRHD
jgi:hypothetical protein